MLPSVVMEMYHPKGKRKKRRYSCFVSVSTSLMCWPWNQQYTRYPILPVYFFRVIFSFSIVYLHNNEAFVVNMDKSVETVQLIGDDNLDI